MRIFVLGIAFLAATAGLRAQTVSPVSPTPPPSPPSPGSLWLGDPGVDVAQARAHVRERHAARLRWEQATSLGDYERAGQKDPRWDPDVHMVFGQYAHMLAQEPGSRTVGAIGAIRHAQAAGCKDPLLMYAYLQLGFYPHDTDPAALARLYAQNELEMEHSGYSALRKLQASFRAAQQAALAVQPRVPGGERLPAPDGTDYTGSLIRARTHLVELLHDPAANPDSVFAAASEFLEFAQDHTGTETPVMEPLVAVFEAAGTDALKTTATTKLAEGVFWVDYAWQARSRRRANNVSQEGWRLFGERLPKAAAALQAAYTLDPSDPDICRKMITVELGQGEGRTRMETWFRRAMDADPDSFAACEDKMGYIEPKWYGSREAMLEFAHQCVATANWQAGLPYVLPQAHKSLSDYWDHPLEYWKQPAVWADMKGFYQAALAVEPKNNYVRSIYALYAYRAEDWKMADELFKALGDKADVRGLECTKAQYEEMRRVVSSKVSETGPGGDAVIP